MPTFENLFGGEKTNDGKKKVLLNIKNYKNFIINYNMAS